MHLFNDYTKNSYQNRILCSLLDYRLIKPLPRSVKRASNKATDLFCTICSTYSHPLDRSSSPRLIERPSDFLAACCLDQATLINCFKLQTIHIRHIFIDPLQSTRQSIFDYMFKVNVIIKIIEHRYHIHNCCMLNL